MDGAGAALGGSEGRLRRQNQTLVDLSRRQKFYRGDFQAALAEITQMAASTLEVERVGVFLYNADRNAIQCINLYERGPNRHSQGITLFAQDYPQYFQALESERIIAAHDAGTDPRTAEFQPNYLIPLGLTSLLDAPIWVGGTMVGVVCHEHMGLKRYWLPEEQSFAGAIADMVALALEARDRHQAEAELQKTNQQLRNILESLTSGFFSLNETAEFTYINPQAEPLLQHSRAELLGHNLWQFFPELRGSSFFPYYQEAITDQVTVKFEDYYPRLNRWLEIHICPFQTGVAVYLADISERKRTEAALIETKERYALAIQGANDGIWDWNLVNDEIYFSLRWKNILGYSESEVDNRLEEWFNRIHPQDLERVKLKLHLHQQGQSTHFEEQYRLRHKNGKYRWVLSRGIAVRNSEGKAYRMAGSLSDISEQRLAQEQLMHDALHDPLTGLPNRTLFMDRLRQVIHHARRHRNYNFAVLFVDLDRFKVINDSLGHLAGDTLLIELAHRFQIGLRPDDTVARLGGDEFVILLDDLLELEESIRIAHRIQTLVQQPFIINGQTVFTSASIGIAPKDTHHHKPEHYLRNADIAMYRAKAAGGSRHVLFTSVMHTSALVRLKLETDLRQALERQELRLQYQPILCLNTDQIVGFEALVRWQHPRDGLIAPGHFITVAEETGLIVPIGEWVLQEACRQMQCWHTQFGQVLPLMISVNLSSKQLSQPDLLQQVDRMLAETGLRPQQLKLEITESMILDNTEVARQTLLKLKERQIQLSMDDFGTGYSSLNYLHRLPIDLLKIDRSFIHEMDNGEESRELVRAIISIAHSLKMEVIAEGIETRSQLEQLYELGCEFGQGYLFSTPLDPEPAADFLQQAFLKQTNSPIS